MDFEDLALAVRERLGASLLAPVPLARLADRTRIGEYDVRAAHHRLLPFSTWGVTTFVREEATIWLNGEAWPELAAGVPRTRFTVAHELGHVLLHGEIVDLDGHHEPDHQAAIEQEANRFAAHLLVPDAALQRLNIIASDAAHNVLAKRFGVSLRMAERRLAEWSQRR